LLIALFSPSTEPITLLKLYPTINKTVKAIHT